MGIFSSKNSRAGYSLYRISVFVDLTSARYSRLGFPYCASANQSFLQIYIQDGNLITPLKDNISLKGNKALQ